MDRQLTREDVGLGGAGIRRAVPHARDVGLNEAVLKFLGEIPGNQ